MNTNVRLKKFNERSFKDIEADTEEYGYKIVEMNSIVNSINESRIF